MSRPKYLLKRNTNGISIEGGEEFYPYDGGIYIYINVDNTLLHTANMNRYYNISSIVINTINIPISKDEDGYHFKINDDDITDNVVLEVLDGLKKYNTDDNQKYYIKLNNYSDVGILRKVVDDFGGNNLEYRYLEMKNGILNSYRIVFNKDESTNKLNVAFSIEIQNLYPYPINITVNDNLEAINFITSFRNKAIVPTRRVKVETTIGEPYNVNYYRQYDFTDDFFEDVVDDIKNVFGNTNVIINEGGNVNTIIPLEASTDDVYIFESNNCSYLYNLGSTNLIDTHTNYRIRFDKTNKTCTIVILAYDELVPIKEMQSN